jgi:8-oxo-dGTP pyrophosphatase MutT (NUDIX family)
MLALRHAPIPWWLKYRAIWLAQPKAVLAAAAIIPDAEGRALVLRARYSGSWMLPGGALNVGEGPRSAMLRECREELGRQVVVERLTGVYLTHGASILFTRGQRALFVFRCAPLGGSPWLSEEHDAFRYIDPAEAPSRLRLCIADALAGQDEVRLTALPPGR